LFLNLHAIAKKNKRADHLELFQEWRDSMKCPTSSQFDVYSLKYDQKQLTRCNFPGIDAYRAVLGYIGWKVKVEGMDSTITETKGWMTEYNVRHNFTSPWRLVEDYNAYDVRNLEHQLRMFRNVTATTLLKYFDSATVEEWLEQKILPLEEKLRHISHLMQSLVLRKVWPRRPIR
jgi:hexosaminidase